MKYIIGLIFSFCCTISWAKPKEITVGLIPGNGLEMRAKAEELAKVLQTKLNVGVNIYIPKKYENLIQAMKDKK
ncbi:MAG: hypothetical protein KDD37_04950, partial [Bdellovibrionales bacterium]|nr:hypothetical protein [Bdellovibrionales bacterium]